MSEPRTTAEQWAARVAAIAVDALLDAGLVNRAQSEAAVAIIAEEIFARLCCNDAPPPLVDHPGEEAEERPANEDSPSTRA